MKHKIGDTVCIQSRAWMERNQYPKFARALAGKIATITGVELFNKAMWFRINLDDGEHLWNEDEFDPGCRSDEPLSSEEAILAMLDGETLYSADGTRYWFKDAYFHWEAEDGCGGEQVKQFTGLRRRPQKRKRTMSREEMLAWSTSEESHGWMVRCGEEDYWKFPPTFGYSFHLGDYQRARLLPNLSGVDPATIQGFEVEE
jgi:hypothetical protein